MRHCLLLLITLPWLSIAQVYLFQVDTLHVGDGTVLTPGYLYVSGDTIVAVDDKPLPNLLPDSTVRLEGHAYPALIAMSTLLGLVEIGAIRATRDYAEQGRFNPNVRPIVAYNTDSKIIPTTRSNGILLAQVRPAGGILAGKTAITYLTGRTWEEASIVADHGQYIYWPARYRRTGWWAEPGTLKENERWEENVRKLYDFFAHARSYLESDVPPHRRNPRYEGLRDVILGHQPVYIQADYAVDIASALQFADSFDLSMVLVSGRGLAPMLNELARRNVPVVLQSPHTLPLNRDDAIDAWYAMPAKLAQHGIPFAIAINDIWDGVWQQRNLPLVAGTAVGYGLDPEAALMAITLTPAQILGIDNRFGSLQRGKEATFFVSTGDVLEIATSQVTAAFVRGQRIPLVDHHKQLYQQYSRIYGLPVQ